MSRLLIPGLGLALAAALMLAGTQWAAATKAQAATAEARAEIQKVRAEFAAYRATQEAQARQALEDLQTESVRTIKAQQEALNAEFQERQAAERAADQLRASHGQLQRLASDLATSLGDQAERAAAAGRCEAAGARARVLADVLGELDGFAGQVVAEADGRRRAGLFCERTHDALTAEDAKP